MSDKPQKTLKVMRLIINRIEFEPNTTDSDIKLKVLVDGVRQYKVAVPAGGSLSRGNIMTCDVWDGSKITIKLKVQPGLFRRILSSRPSEVFVDFYVVGGAGCTGEERDIKLNSTSHKLVVHGTLSQLNDEESDKFVAEILPVFHGINRALGVDKFKLPRGTITSTFRLPTKQLKTIKNSYRIMRVFTGDQNGLLKDMVHVWKTSSIIPNCPESLKTIQLYELAQHDLHDKVFFIENCKYRTGVKAPQIAEGESLTGSLSRREHKNGRKWRFMKYDGEDANWYLIRLEDHKDRFAGVGDEFVQLSGIETWWALEPVGEHTGRYIIKQRNRDFCWNLEDSENGTPVKLKECVKKDESNHWNLRLTEDI